MSDEESASVETHMLQAEYKDGQLQIVEVTPFERDKLEAEQGESILPDMIQTGDDQRKYMQVLDMGSGSSNKGLMQLDLLNLTLVRCEDGEESYRLVTNSEDGSEMSTDGTVTCVLQSSDGDEEQDKSEYVMVDETSGLVFLRSASPPRDAAPPVPQTDRPPETKRRPTPAQILNKSKAMQRARAILASSSVVRQGKRGRRKAGELPPAHELLASPSFKLYLYSCKACAFKCNATKELQAHRAAEHGGGAGKAGRSPAARHHAALQCARCPYRANTHPQLMKHVETSHSAPLEVTVTTESVTYTNKISLNSKEVEEADVLVCGACGYESAERDAFKEHIETQHGATTV